MMTGKFVSTFALLATVALVACAPQRRQPIKGSAKVVDKAAKPASPDQINVAKGSATDVKKDPNFTSPAAPRSATDKILDSVQSVKSTTMVSGSNDDILKVEMIDYKGQNINVGIPNTKDGKANVSSNSQLITNQTSASFTCKSNPASLILDCDDALIVLQIPVLKDNNQTAGTKTLRIERILQHNLGVLRTLGTTPEEAQGSALLEKDLASVDGDGGLSEAKNFYSIKISGKNTTDDKNNITAHFTNSAGNEVYDVTVSGLPVKDLTEDLTYDQNLTLVNSDNNVIEMSGKMFSFSQKQAAIDLKVQLKTTASEAAAAQKVKDDTARAILRTSMKTPGDSDQDAASQQVAAGQTSQAPTAQAQTQTPQEHQIQNAYSQAEDSSGR